MQTRGKFTLTIQRKLTLMMLSTCAMALVLAIGSLVLFDSINERQNIMAQLNRQASFLAENCRPALVFEQHDLAFTLLEGLLEDPIIAAAGVFDSQTNLVAHQIITTTSIQLDLPNALSQEISAESSHVRIIRDIQIGDEHLGYIYLLGDLRPLKHRLFNFLGIGMLVLVFTFGVAVLVSAYLQRFISLPILELTAIANHVIKSKDSRLRATRRSNDEVGRLIEIFNEMLDTIESREKALHRAQNELESRVVERTKRLSSTNESLEREINERKKARNEVLQLNSQLLETTRRAGMAEVASGVLHNVGNVLNSVNVSAGVIQHRLQESESAQFSQVIELLKQHTENLSDFLTKDSRGKQMLDYLEAFSQHLQHEETVLNKEAGNLAKNVDHIKEIIATQQRHAVGIGITECYPVDQLIDEITTLYSESLRQANIVMISEYEDTPEIVTDRNKVIQILGNLILNGRDAVQSSKGDRREIHIKTRVTAENRIAIQVQDTGIGIQPENLRWIFTHGYTTKEDGHGLGLHSCAIAAQELNGSLRVVSEGEEQGATFILELPIN